MARGAHRQEIRGPAASYSTSHRPYMNGPSRARLRLRRRLLRCRRTDARKMTPEPKKPMRELQRQGTCVDSVQIRSPRFTFPNDCPSRW
jgi:hypothetical protein